LIEKLIYLTCTRPDITFVVRVPSRFMHQLREVHWTAALRSLAYIKSSPGKGLLYKNMGTYAFLGTLILVMLVTKGEEIYHWILHFCWRKSCHLKEQEIRCGISL